MTDFDQKMRSALSADETEDFARLSAPALLEQVIETFRGRNRRLVILAVVMALTWTIVGGVSAYQFFHVEEIRAMIAWAGAFGFSLLTVALVKIWYWMELNKNAVTREVKRVELLLTQIALSGSNR
jgi:hypothetical protein